ncbi:MAG: 30S ribosomal protein S4 [Nitrospirae bacterium]|nr:30S ribosomal protein S4 [Nitrospirota bacterium]
MARYIGAECKLCRREGVKLFLKGERCYKDKCAFERRSYAPGQHGQSRKAKVSEYSTQLREKQKLKRVFGVLERQFKNYFKKAEMAKGITGENLLQFLVRRLDNIVYEMGFASSRVQARQFVRHGHISVNSRRVNIPSYLVKSGDVIEVNEKSRQLEGIKAAVAAGEGRSIPQWLEVDRANFKGSLVSLPTREEIMLPVSEHLVVELYSR